MDLHHYILNYLTHDVMRYAEKHTNHMLFIGLAAAFVVYCIATKKLRF